MSGDEMPSIRDDRGYNQGFKPSASMDIRTSRRSDYMMEHSHVDAESEVLEIGCGTGGISYELAAKSGARVYGTDLCVPFIEQARAMYQLPNLEYGTLDFNSRHDLAGVERTRKFNAIVGNGILHHLYYNLDESLRNIFFLLSPGGRIVFLEPNILNPYCLLIFKVPLLRKWAKLEPAEMAFSRRYIRAKLEQAGFENIKVEYKDFLLPGVPKLLIKPVVAIGALLEVTPVLRLWSQSIFISASRPS